ncbi:hypothetical protein PLICRDRAFT_271850 [Plicaturopsis crispa FD-325 SS-3]|nr:hypothetical protein PLICRDRAFT_271850 [Plicaturopsis crispa FD-325 SS-3]
MHFNSMMISLVSLAVSGAFSAPVDATHSALLPNPTLPANSPPIVANPIGSGNSPPLIGDRGNLPRSSFPDLSGLRQPAVVDPISQPNAPLFNPANPAHPILPRASKGHAFTSSHLSKPTGPANSPPLIPEDPENNTPIVSNPIGSGNSPPLLPVRALADITEGIPESVRGACNGRPLSRCAIAKRVLSGPGLAPPAIGLDQESSTVESGEEKRSPRLRLTAGEVVVNPPANV